MPWVEFTQDFRWTPEKMIRVSIAYKKGMRLFVTRECANKAIAKGKAVPSTRPENRDAGR